MIVTQNVRIVVDIPSPKNQSAQHSIRTMKTKIYGASDDLIEIDGAIYDEVGCFKSGKQCESSDGTKWHISYDGNWVIEVTEKGDKFEELIPAVGDDNEHTHPEAKGLSSYSDILILSEGIEWIKVGKKTFKV